MQTNTSSAAAEHESLARRAFAQLGRRDLSNPELIWAEDAVDHFLAVGDAVGRDGIVAFFEGLFAALPDFTVEVERVVATDTMLVVQWTGRGTFTGARFQGVRPTGRPVEIRGCDVVEMRDRLVIDNTVYWDGAAFARDVGLLPAQGSLADRLLIRAFNSFTYIRTLGGRRLGAKS
jgi:steroid delta-isomerase-like uncharacterized protein